MEHKEVFATFINLCLVYFCLSMNWRFKAYNTVVSEIFTESDEAFAMLLFKIIVNDYVKMIEIQRKLSRKEAKPKYTKDPNVNESLGGGPIKELEYTMI